MPNTLHLLPAPLLRRAYDAGLLDDLDLANALVLLPGHRQRADDAWIASLAADGPTAVAAAVALLPQTPAAVVDVLLGRDDVRVWRDLAYRPDLSRSHVQQLAGLDDSEVANRLVLNPATPERVAAELSERLGITCPARHRSRARQLVAGAVPPAPGVLVSLDGLDDLSIARLYSFSHDLVDQLCRWRPDLVPTDELLRLAGPLPRAALGLLLRAGADVPVSLIGSNEQLLLTAHQVLEQVVPARAALTLATRNAPQVAAAVADALGDDPDTWHAFAELAEGWDGTLRQLLTAASLAA